jgi:hypothetical protein
MKHIINRALNWVLGLMGLGLAAGVHALWAADGTRNSMMAESPMSDYTVGVVAYVIVIGFLVSILLIGGLLVLNLGLLSKREEDHTGVRNPSDVGILKGSTWPQEPDTSPILPAEDHEEDVAA